MKKLLCTLMVLAVTATASGAEHWTGFAGNNLWSDVDNWDDMLPWVISGSGSSWDANKYDKYGNPELGTPSNHVINVDVDGFVGAGTIGAVDGYTSTMAILSGITLESYNLTLENAPNSSSAVHLTVQTGATLNVDEGDATLVIGRHNTVTIEAGATCYADYLEFHDGYAVLDVYGTMGTWRLKKYSDDPGHEINIRGGGQFRIGPEGINWDGNTSRRFNMYNLGTFQIWGDYSANYLDIVQAAEIGTWVVDYSVTLPGFTTIRLVAPCWDQDDDDDIDMVDFAEFQRCLTIGAPAAGVVASCECYDVRSTGGATASDGEVDAWDLAAFTECVSGPGIEADPACLD